MTALSAAVKQLRLNIAESGYVLQQYAQQEQEVLAVAGDWAVFACSREVTGLLESIFAIKSYSGDNSSGGKDSDNSAA